MKGALVYRLRFAQQGIALLIPTEQADDRSVSAHYAETDLSESCSPLWGDRIKTDCLSVFSGSARRTKNRVTIRLDLADRIAAGVSGHVPADICCPIGVNGAKASVKVCLTQTFTTQMITNHC